MRTWEDYKNHVKAQSLDEKENMERIEELSAIIGKMIIRREELGLSQRDLAKKCGITQSALARLESYSPAGYHAESIKAAGPHFERDPDRGYSANKGSVISSKKISSRLSRTGGNISTHFPAAGPASVPPGRPGWW